MFDLTLLLFYLLAFYLPNCIITIIACCVTHFNDENTLHQLNNV